MMVVCGGELVETISLPKSNKRIFYYVLDQMTAAPSITLAAGPFEVISLFNDQLRIDMFKPKVLEFFQQYIGSSFPYSSFKAVFIEDAYNTFSTGATMGIFGSHLLHGPEIIDQAFETRRVLCRAVATQWFGHYIAPKAWADIWLITGLANYMTSLFLRKHFGNNEFRYRMHKDMQRVCALDVNQPALYPNRSGSLRTELISLKSPIVLHMLDRRMGGKGHQILKVVNKVLVSALSGELPLGLSTHHFLKVCRKVCGNIKESGAQQFSPDALRAFANQWIYSSGVPRFGFSYRFSRRKMIVEILFKQENTNAGHPGAAPLFNGPLTIRIHEPSGTFDTEVMLSDAEQRLEIQYHSKYKRVRRAFGDRVRGGRGSRGGRGGRGKGKVGGGKDGGSSGLNFGEDDDEEDDDDDGGPEEGGNTGGARGDDRGAQELTFEWIRLDPDNDWLCEKSFEQMDFMWMAQLQKDRDVVAQYEAVQALYRMPTVSSANALYSIMTDPKTYFRIRCDAAHALVSCATESLNWIGLNLLLRAYHDRLPLQQDSALQEFPGGKLDVTSPMSWCMPKPNQFESFQEYFVQKAIAGAIATVRDSEGLTPTMIRRFVLDLLKFNDNEGNAYSDCFFVSELILRLGSCFLPSYLIPSLVKAPRPRDLELFRLAIKAVERQMNRDLIMPSYHNVLTASGLQVGYGYGSFLHIRLAAFDALIVLGLLKREILLYLVGVIREDPCSYVRYYVARSLSAILIVAMHSGPATAAAAIGAPVDSQSLRHTEGADAAQKSSSIDAGGIGNPSGWSDVKKSLGAMPQVKAALWDLLNSRYTAYDHRLRIHVLQICDILHDHPVEKTSVPKLRFKMSISRRAMEREEEVRFNSPAFLKCHSIFEILQSSASEDEGTTKSGKVVVLEPAKVQPTKAQPAKSKSSKSAKKGIDYDSPAMQQTLSSRPINPKFVALGNELLNRLRNHGAAARFMVPVDELQAPNYYKMIKKPMDLMTMGKKLAAGSYGNELPALIADVRRIFSNCFAYNEDDSLVYNQGKRLQSYFEEEILPMVQSGLGEAGVTSTTAPKLVLKTGSKVQNADAGGVKKAVDVASDVVMVQQPSSSDTPNDSNIPVDRPKAVSSPSVSKPETSEPKVEVQTGNLAPNDAKNCKRILKEIMKHPSARWFIVPVDPVALGIPTYLSIIKNPMDLSTVKSKLDKGSYSNPSEFESDMRLIFNNAMTFNPPLTKVHIDAKVVLGAFESQLTGAPSKISTSTSIPQQAPTVITGLSSGDKKRCERVLKALVAMDTNKKDSIGSRASSAAVPLKEAADGKKAKKVLQKVQKHKASSPFLQPVDPIALGIPTYFQIIKRPMDLSTVDKKFEDGTYKTLDEMVADFRLMFDNCYLFNADPLFEKEWIAQSLPLKERSGSIGPSSSQRAGKPTRARISGVDRARVNAMLEKLRTHPDALYFLEPVDDTILPDYRIKIKNPIDLRTMQTKVDGGDGKSIQGYSNIPEFEADMKLLFSNCYSYNAKHSQGYMCGASLEKFFKK
ncbi:hypothetical protein BJ742DRAFT_661105, partial [Cladochytrium replicatum]